LRGGTQTVGGNLTLSGTIRQFGYLTLTNGATLNVNGDLVTYASGDGTRHYVAIDVGSMLNISNDFVWQGSMNRPFFPGDGLTIGGTIQVGANASSAHLGIDGGRVVADRLIVGGGIQNNIDSLLLTNNATISLRRPDSGDVVNIVGQDGHIQPNVAALYLGTPTDPGTIDIEEDGGAGTHSLAVSLDSYLDNTTAAAMSVIGWGHIDLDGTLQNNGKIIANGYGSDRDLVLTNFAAITQDDSHGDQVATGFVLEDGTRAGWYAIDGGKLILPALTNLTAHSTVRWGDTIDDLDVTSNDLVNSVMLNFTNCTGGDVLGAVVATNRGDDQVLFSDTVIGIWEFDGSAFTFGASGRVQVTLRYDEGLMNTKGLAEAELKVWKYPGFGNSTYWEDVTDTVNTDANLITATWQGSLSQFVVSTAAPGAEPPPGTMIILK